MFSSPIVDLTQLNYYNSKYLLLHKSIQTIEKTKIANIDNQFQKYLYRRKFILLKNSVFY